MQRLTPAPKYTEQSDKKSAKLAQIETHLFEVRNSLTASGVTGEEKKRMTDLLVRLETERHNLSSVESDSVPSDSRESVIAEAERWEDKASDLTLSDGERKVAANTAVSIREAINRVDTKQRDLSILHEQQANVAEAQAELDAKAVVDAQAAFDEEIKQHETAEKAKGG